MKKVCVNPNLKGVGEFIKTSSEIFKGYLSPGEVLGLLNSWIETTNRTDFPTEEEFMKYYTDLASQTKEELFKNTPVSKKEDTLDLIQALYFEGLLQLSESPVITRKIVSEYSQKVLDQLPEIFKDQGMGIVAERWKEYEELFRKSRLKSLSIPSDIIDDQVDAKDTIGDRSSIMDDPMGRASDEVVYLFASLLSDEENYGLLKPINFSYAYNVVSNLLGGTTNRAEQIAKLEENKEKYPFIDQILDKMGYPAGPEAIYSPVRTSFNEAFSKAAYDFTSASAGEKNSYSQLDFDTRNTLLAQYKSNFYMNGFSKKHLGKTILNNELIKPLLENGTQEGVIAFLNAFGIPIYSLSPTGLIRARQLMKDVKEKVDKDQNLTWIVERTADEELGTEKTKYVRDLNALLDELSAEEQETKKLMARNSEGESQYSIANHNYFTTLWSKLKGRTDKVYTAFEKLFVNGDIKPAVSVGLESKDREKGKSFNKLTLGEIYIAKFSNMFSTQPSINLPVTSDKSMARALKFKKFSADNETELNQRMAYTQITVPLWQRLYAAYERDLNQQFHPDWKYGSDRAIDFWHGTEQMEGLLGPQTEKVTKERFMAIIQSWIKEQNAAVTKDLENTGAIKIIEKKDKEGNVINRSKIVNFTMPNELGKYNLSQEQKIAKTVENYNFNELLFGIENTQLMYGSMVGVKLSNFFKRNAGGVAEGRTLDVSPELTNQILAERDKYPFDMTMYPADKLRVFIHSETFDKSEKDLVKFNAAYEKNNLDDAQGTMPLEMYKEILVRANAWTPKMDRVFNKVIKGQKLTKDDYAAFPPMKPVGYSLVNVDGHKIPVYIKTAIYPIFKTDTKGTLNEKKYDLMRSKGIGLIIPSSGIKMAVPANLKPLFENGEIKFDPSNMVDFSLEDFKIQLDINEKTSSQNLMGTQQAKLKWTDLFTDGKAIDEKWRKLLDENINTLQGISDIETKRLEETIGITREGNDYKISNYTKLVEHLRDELLSRDVSTNTIEAIRSIIDSDGNLLHPIDGLPSRQKLMNLLNSIVTNRLIKLYTNGSSLVQLSQHGFELAEIADPTDENIDAIESSIEFISKEAKRNYYKNKGLSFFSLGEKTGAAEILLPAKYRKNLSKDADGNYILNEDVLVNIGYRIPTQGHNSMLHLRVVGFLPEHYDQAIVMPKEITTQGGSDFDVDKINIFIPNTISLNGKKEFISSEMDPEEIYKQFLTETENLKFEKEERKLNKSVKSDLGKIDEKYLPENFTDEELDEIALDRGLSKEEWIDNFKLKQYQNQIITQTITILEDPAVQSALLTPNSANKLEALVKPGPNGEAPFLPKELRVKITPTFRNLFSGKTLSKMAYQMSAAKSLVGVFASQATNHSLAQQVGLHVKTGRELFFSHNKVNEEISLSGVTSKAGDYKISEMLGNQLLTAAVDAAKDDYLTDLGINLVTGDFASTFVRTGGDIKYLVAWLKSPIIQEYLKEKAINDGLMTTGYKTSRSKLIKKVIESIYPNAEIESEYLLDNYGYSREGVIDKVKGKEMAGRMLEARKDEGEYDPKLMLNYAKSIDSKNPNYQTMAIQLLDDFLYFEDFASTVRGNISNTKFDTQGPGKDIIETTLIQLNLKSFINKMKGSKGYTLATLNSDGVQEPFEKIISNTLLNVFYKKSGEFVQSIYSDLTAFNIDESLNSAVINLITPGEEDSWVNSTADLDLANLIYSSAINYLIQNQKPFRKELFYGDNTVAHRVKAIQMNPDHSLHSNYIIERIFKPEPSPVDNKPSIITIADKSSDSKQASYITQSFQEIKDNDPTLYNDLIEMNLYQSGVVQSPSSFYSFLPYDDVSKKVNGGLTREYMYNTFLQNAELDLAKEVIANLGSKMNNLKFVKTDVKNNPTVGNAKSILTLRNEDTNGNMFINHTTIYGEGSKFTGQYMKIEMGNDSETSAYQYIKPKNMGTLFYNLNVQEEHTIENEQKEPDSEIEEQDSEFEEWLKTSKEASPFWTREENLAYFNKCVRGKK